MVDRPPISPGSVLDESFLFVPMSEAHTGDVLSQAVQDLQWGVLERFSRIAGAYRKTRALFLNEMRPPVNAVVGSRPFSAAQIALAHWAHAMHSIRTREAAEGINQPPASLEEIEGLTSSYSILAASALNANVDPVWDETAEHQTDLGTFEVLSTDSVPLGTQPTRVKPLSQPEWDAFFDTETGTLKVASEDVRLRIYQGVSEAAVQLEEMKEAEEFNSRAWSHPYAEKSGSFFLEYIPGHLRFQTGTQFSKRKGMCSSRASCTFLPCTYDFYREEYWSMRRRWQEKCRAGTAEEAATSDDAALADALMRVEKDVIRTDRQDPFYKSDPSRTVVLHDILVTYSYAFPGNDNIGYVQGMADLASPIVIAMSGNEVDAFWCFAGFMERMKSNFLRTGAGMHRKLSIMADLIKVFDPFLFEHLRATESLDLFFCFRWFLVWFKRELGMGDLPRLWEVLWTCDDGGEGLAMFFALAIVMDHRDVVCRFLGCFDEILKYINDLSMTIDLDATLEKAQLLVTRCEARAAVAGMTLVEGIGPKDLDLVMRTLLRLAEKPEQEGQ